MTEFAIPNNAGSRAAIARPVIAPFLAGARVRRRGWRAAVGRRLRRTRQRLGADGVGRAVLDPPFQAGPP